MVCPRSAEAESRIPPIRARLAEIARTTRATYLFSAGLNKRERERIDRRIRGWRRSRYPAPYR